VAQASGFLIGKAKGIQGQYKESLSVVQGWRITDIASSINVVHPSGVLGKPVRGNLFLSDSEMATHRVVA
jgi:hypothetical protein